MSNRGIRRWAMLGALVSAALLAPACEKQWPEAGKANEGLANEGQSNETLPRTQSGVEQQGAQQPATGGSGLQQQQQQQDVDSLNVENLPGQPQVTPPAQGQGDRQRIGAPGYTDPRELPQTDQGVEVPPADQYENREPNYRRGDESGESSPSK